MKSYRSLDGQGRVILPVHIRKSLGLAKDSRLSIEQQEDGTIIIAPAEERCAICGGTLRRGSITIDAPEGEKRLCKACMLTVCKKSMGLPREEL